MVTSQGRWYREFKIATIAWKGPVMNYFLTDNSSLIDTYRILVVHRDKASSEQISRLFRIYNVDLAFVCESLDFWKQLEFQPPDMILMISSGTEVDHSFLRETLRQTGLTARIPLVIYSHEELQGGDRLHHRPGHHLLDRVSDHLPLQLR